jgi:hypothetical protein
MNPESKSKNPFVLPPPQSTTKTIKRKRRKARQDAMKRGLLVTPDVIKNQMDKLVGQNVYIKRFDKNHSEKLWQPVTIAPRFDQNGKIRTYSTISNPSSFNISTASGPIGFVELEDDSPVRLMTLSPEIATQAAAAAQKHNQNLSLRRRALAAMPRGVFGEERKQMENTTLLEPRHMEIPIHHLLKKKNIQDNSKDEWTTVGSSGKHRGGRKTRRKRRRKTRRKRRRKTRRKRKYKPKRKN